MYRPTFYQSFPYNFFKGLLSKLYQSTNAYDFLNQVENNNNQGCANQKTNKRKRKSFLSKRKSKKFKSNGDAGMFN